MTIMTEDFSPRPLLFAISANPQKVFKCFTMLDRSLGSSPLGGTLNFSLWIAKVLALELDSLVATSENNTTTFTVAELASLFAISRAMLQISCGKNPLKITVNVNP